MCGVCEQIKGLPTKQALEVIAEASRRRGMNRHLSRVLDGVLGTETETEVDQEAEQAAFRVMQGRRQEGEEP